MLYDILAFKKHDKCLPKAMNSLLMGIVIKIRSMPKKTNKRYRDSKMS